MLRLRNRKRGNGRRRLRRLYAVVRGFGAGGKSIPHRLAQLRIILFGGLSEESYAGEEKGQQNGFHGFFGFVAGVLPGSTGGEEGLDKVGAALIGAGAGFGVEIVRVVVRPAGSARPGFLR